MSQGNRQHYRMFLNCQVFLEAPGQEGESAEVILTETLDVSLGGLKVKVAKELPRDSILSLGVDFPGLDRTLHLVADLKWCRPSGDDQWTAGLQLLHADGTDIAAWRELLEDL